MVLETLKSYKWNENWKSRYSGIYKPDHSFSHQIMTLSKMTNCHASYVTGGFSQPLKKQPVLSRAWQWTHPGLFWIHCSLSVAHLTSTDYLKVGVECKVIVIDGTFKKAISNLNKLPEHQPILRQKSPSPSFVKSREGRVEAVWAPWVTFPNSTSSQLASILELFPGWLSSAPRLSWSCALCNKEILFFYSSVPWHCTEQIIIRKPPEGKVTVQLSVVMDKPHFYPYKQGKPLTFKTDTVRTLSLAVPCPEKEAVTEMTASTTTEMRTKVFLLPVWL